MENLFGGDLDARLAAFAAIAATEEATAGRTRQHWLRHAAVEDSTLRGVLVDLAERQVVSAFQVTSGRRHRGVVGMVGADFCVVLAPAGNEIVLNVHAIGWVRPDVVTTPTGDHDDDLRLTFAGALTALAEDRPRVSIGSRGRGELVAGELVDVGRDVVVVRSNGPTGPAAYVPLPTIADVVVVS